MRIFLRKIFSSLASDSTRRFLKRTEQRFKKKLMTYASSMKKSDFEKLFRDEFKLRAGNVVLVHAGTSMLKTDLGAPEIVGVLQEVITETGTIVVLTYSRRSVRYLLRKSPFKARSTPSGMGAISEVVRKSPSASRSTHPIKSIAALGAKAEAICTGHEQGVYSFGSNSPYKKLYDLEVKVIVRANSEKFCRNNLLRENYVIKPRWLTDFFCVDGRALTDEIRSAQGKGITLYD